MSNEGKDVPWLRLKGKIADEVFTAPKIGFDPDGRAAAPQVNSRIVGYLERTIAGKPWANHLALAVLVLTAHRLDAASLSNNLGQLHPRFIKLFKALGLKSMEQWNPNVHIPLYLRGEVVEGDSTCERLGFLAVYKNIQRHESKWLQTLPPASRQLYGQFCLPVVDLALTEGILRWKEVRDKQRENRKAETSALVPLYPKLRAEAHFRFGIMSRLRQAYRDALDKLVKGKHELPFSFFYDAGGDPDRGVPAQERLHFRIWERSGLVLANQGNYSPWTIKCAKRKLKHFKTPRFYLEFVRSERLTKDAVPEGLWFEELLRIGVIGHSRPSLEQRRWLYSRGYVERMAQGKKVGPFGGFNGVLSWSAVDSNFLKKAQTYRGMVLIPVEPFYVAALFGLLAIDIFTTTGARMNELLQVRLDKEGFARLEMPAPAGAKDQSPRVRYVLKMIPKGQRLNKKADYYLGRETERLIAKVARMLAEHYDLDVDKGQTLPIVKFTRTNMRAHRFGPARYLFQYNRAHFSGNAIHSCMRFLLHGMELATADGKPVIIKSHLLRHAFATHAVHVEKIPIDIVRAILNQKDLGVTEYYSQPTESIVAEATDMLLARMAAHVNLRELLLRSPEELRQQFEEAAKVIGTLGEVPGGHCTFNDICPHHMACIGCPAKVPDPDKRYQLLNDKRYAEERLKTCIKEGLVREAEKLKQKLRQCEAELKEMDMIEAYRKDETRVAIIQIEPRRRT